MILPQPSLAIDGYSELIFPPRLRLLTGDLEAAGHEEEGTFKNVEAFEEPGQLIIRLLDHGLTYAPDQVPQPDLENPLKQQAGWGVFLSKTGVDQFDYTSTDSGNVHRFVVRLKRG